MNRRVGEPRRSGRVRAESRLSGAGLIGALTRGRGPRPEHDASRAGPPGPGGIGSGYIAMLLLVVALVGGAFLAHLHVRYEGIRLGYETSKARAVRTRLLLERRELRLELASLKSPDQIEIEARERLGMVAPDHSRIVPIRPRRTVAASGGAL